MQCYPFSPPPLRVPNTDEIKQIVQANIDDGSYHHVSSFPDVPGRGETRLKKSFRLTMMIA